jgi:c-di-GMP-binding flagellar brake protein YcgR
LDSSNQSQVQLERGSVFVENRRYQRYKMEVAIRVYPRNSVVLRGHSVDVSESGISVMLQEEVPIGEIVRLEFDSDFGAVEIHATVRQRTAFRYGFQFIEGGPSAHVIRRSCRHLAMKQSSQGGAS